MMNLLKFLLFSQLKRSQLAQKKNGGFTLIEVLVAMILAALVIGPLLGFMVNILDSDRKEQAKAASEQEIKAALDYIAQDLSQAVYIYDAAGLNNPSTAATPGIRDQIPPIKTVGACDALATCKPVLVFWKRKLLTSAEVGTLTGGNDAFVYSLVGYYLIRDAGLNSNWSNTARIGRFEIKDGIRSPNTTGTPRVEGTSTVYYKKLPDKGFQLFDLSLPGDLSTKMNQWKQHPQGYDVANMTNHPISSVLIDYVDRTPAGATCPAGLTPTSSTPGFYACVDASKGFAQVTIRGNALARIQSTPLPTWSAGSVYFPSASIQVQGRGFLYTK
ncbi:MAG: hormogonium polysaccharide secretion pseudopilin HpsC [Cyanobacteriota bacterium]